MRVYFLCVFFCGFTYTSDLFATADTESENIFPRKLTPEVLQALRGVRFIAQHIKDADKDNEVFYRRHSPTPMLVRRENYALLIHDFVCLFSTLALGSTSGGSRVEIRIDGVGPFPVVGVYIELHRWYDWHHIPKSVIV